MASEFYGNIDNFNNAVGSFHGNVDNFNDSTLEFFGDVDNWIANGGGAVNVADVFSIDLSTNPNQVVVNGIDYIADTTLIWSKQRNGTSDHFLVDSVRGIIEKLNSNTTDAQSSALDIINQYNLDGFNTGGNVFGDYVHWSFKKAPKFLGVIKYTGDGVAGREIPHALGVQAGMVVVKDLSNSNEWAIQHIARGGTKSLAYTTAAEAANGSVMWDSTTMTDNVVTLGGATRLNGNGREYIMYVYAHNPSDSGIIQCGSYVGSGASGNNVDLETAWLEGIQYLMIKEATGAGSWGIWDTARGFGTTGADLKLLADNSAGESSAVQIELTATGFKLTSTDSNTNTTGEAYIYMAIRAE